MSVLVVALCAGAVSCGTSSEAAGNTKLPSGARVIGIVSAVAGQRPIVALSVIDPGQIRQIVGWINHMPRVRPGIAYSCPYEPAGEATVTLTFSGHANGPVIARAAETDYGFGSDPATR